MTSANIVEQFDYLQDIASAIVVSYEFTKRDPINFYVKDTLVVGQKVLQLKGGLLTNSEHEEKAKMYESLLGLVLDGIVKGGKK